MKSVVMSLNRFNEMNEEIEKLRKENQELKDRVDVLEKELNEYDRAQLSW